MTENMAPVVCMETSHGTIEIVCDAEKAPLTVKNFLAYVDSGFFDGLIFHRVIPGFMIQGGGFEPGMREKPNQAPVSNEADNGLVNKRGSLAMARTGDPHSATSQFFINLADNSFLNFSSKSSQGWGYAVFAEVSEGLDVVDAIAGVATSNHGPHGDVPVEDVVITKASRL